MLSGAEVMESGVSSTRPSRLTALMLMKSSPTCCSRKRQGRAGRQGSKTSGRSSSARLQRQLQAANSPHCYHPTYQATPARSPA